MEALESQGEAKVVEVDPLEGLTPKRRRFAQAYASNGGNGRKAALEAGFSEGGADQTACKLLKDPRVKAYLATKRVEYAAKVDVDADFVLGNLRKVAEDPDHPGHVRALELLGKHLELFREKVELSGNVAPLVQVVNFAGASASASTGGESK